MLDDPLLPPAGDAFRLLRIKLLRPPPAWILLPSSRRGSVPIELAVGVTDDYGVVVDAFPSLDLRLEILDPETSLPVKGVSIVIEGHLDAGCFTLETARGPFYQLKTTVTFDERTQAYPSNIQLSVSVPPVEDESPPFPALSPESTRMLEVIGETGQRPVEGWDDRSYIFMRVTSGPVELRKPPSRAPKETSSADKVQTALRKIHVPLPPPTPPATFTIIERPGLNNSTGQRLWDCALALSTFLSLHPSFLHHTSPLILPPRPPHLTTLELGAGLALSSLLAAALLPSSSSRILASDIAATVSTTLRENLLANPPYSDRVEPLVLPWGNPVDLSILGGGRGKALTLLGTDILYNPESHGILLETVEGFLRADGVERSQGLVAYKPRTEGDGEFFALARGKGFVVEKVWEWGEMSVWRITDGPGSLVE